MYTICAVSMIVTKACQKVLPNFTATIVAPPLSCIGSRGKNASCAAECKSIELDLAVQKT